MSYLDFKVSESKFIHDTVSLIENGFDSVCRELDESRNQEIVSKLRDQFSTGKMLRTRLGMLLNGGDALNRDHVIKACAATELVHAATLFHDDVIDGAFVRRNHPSLWREVGSSGAILIGDLFFCTAVQLIAEDGNVSTIRSFIDRVREVCATEMVHEIVFSGQEIGVETCIKVARGKTGPLFAFVAEVCGGNDRHKSEDLKEAGYLLGTAYQLADDLLDIVGDENTIGKTLGTDVKRRKFTLAQGNNLSESFILKKIQSLCNTALGYLPNQPGIFDRFNHYVVSELFPFLDVKLECRRNRAASYEVR